MALVTNIPITSATVDNLSRNEYLAWVNECLQSEFSKLEQLHTAAGYCLFTEILFPGQINLRKVKFNSRLELDWLANWKLVQTSWKQLGIEKVIPVEKLIKGKFQDNFEFLQWFKKFFDANYDGHEYNPLEMRNFEELPKEGKLKPGTLKMPQQTAQRSTMANRNTQPPPQRAGSNMSVNSNSGGTASAGYKKASTPSTVSSITAQKPKATMTHSAGRVPQQPTQAQQKQQQPPQPDPKLLDDLKQKDHMIEEMRVQLAESDEVIGGLEKERDFYFAKLRKIEVLCQDNEQAATALNVNDILQILYETEEGFAPPEEVETVASNGTNGDSNH